MTGKRRGSWIPRRLLLVVALALAAVGLVITAPIAVGRWATVRVEALRRGIESRPPGHSVHEVETFFYGEPCEGFPAWALVRAHFRPPEQRGFGHFAYVARFIYYREQADGARDWYRKHYNWSFRRLRFDEIDPEFARNWELEELEDCPVGAPEPYWSKGEGLGAISPALREAVMKHRSQADVGSEEVVKHFKPGVTTRAEVVRLIGRLSMGHSHWTFTFDENDIYQGCYYSSE